MTLTKEQKTHHLKIYPEHFSAVLTGVKRAELRKNDRDFKVGDTLHLMETPKGSCSPTGEFVNAVVTHIADVGDWLPGYVLLSIELEPAYTAPPAPVSVPYEMAISDDMNLYQKSFAQGHNACRAAMLQGAEGNSPAIPDDVRRMDWLVSKTVDVREPMVYGSHSLFWSQTITDEEDDYHATKLREQIDAAMAAENAAAPQQEAE